MRTSAKWATDKKNQDINGDYLSVNQLAAFNDLERFWLESIAWCSALSRDVEKLLIEKRGHIAVVVDEYGGTAGILTMEDVVETLLGRKIVDRFDRTADMQQLARRDDAIQSRSNIFGCKPIPRSHQGTTHTAQSVALLMTCWATLPMK
ncbi:MAG: hypothetical protein QNI85_03540 [Desulfobacterales bacterium]|nr:hypothetical protein [Desulfobacterales bacterium]MDJ0989061.1 hypothetical protein [Desulfobacterales bacterium]